MCKNDLTKNFTILKKCKNKFDCLIYFIFIFLMNWDQVSMYSQTQFVRKFFTFWIVLFLQFFNTPFLHFQT